MTDEANEFGGGQFGGQFGASRSANFKLLVDDCLRACGILTTDTKYRERAITFATYVQLQALKGRHWKFLNRELWIDLDPPYDTGTVSLTQGSRTVIEQEDVDNGAVKEIQWNVTHRGRKFCVPGDFQEFYRVLKINSSTELELASEYVGTTNAPASYTLLKDRYVLDVKVQKIGSVTIGGIGEIKPIGLQKFRTMEASNPSLTGFPEYYTIVHVEEDSGQVTLEFYPSPEKRYSCRIEYIEAVTTPEDSETCFPTIPPEHMDVLYYGIVAEIYRYQNNPAMLEDARRQYLNVWNRFASDQDMVDSVARIQHGRHYFNRFRNRYPGYYGFRWFGKVED